MARPTSTLSRDERGATAVEYGLIVSLIVITVLAAIIQLAGATTGIWTDVSTKVRSSSQAAGAN